MHGNIIETIMGGVVLIVAVVFLVFAYTSTSTGTVGGYPVTAKFGDVDGDRPGERCEALQHRWQRGGHGA